MATTVASIGAGQDFASISAWWEFARNQADANQHGVLAAGEHAGAVLGPPKPGKMTNLDADNHPRLYAAEGAGHRGAIPPALNSIARVTSETICRCPFVRFGLAPGQPGEGYMIDIADGRAFQIAGTSSRVKPTGTVIDGLLIRSHNPMQNSGVVVQWALADAAAGPMSFEARNNIVVVTGSTVHFSQTNSIWTILYAAPNLGATITAILTNNTFVNHAATAVHPIVSCINLQALAGNALTGLLRNNAVFKGAARQAFNKGMNGSYGLAGSGWNAADDATPDTVIGGSGNIVNTIATNEFVDPASDWTLRPTAASRNAGSLVVAYDALRRPRPFGPGVDLGALELITTATTRQRGGASGGGHRALSAGLRTR